MHKLLIGTLAALLVLTSPAFARERWVRVRPIVSQPTCPAGVPIQTITVVNQARVRPDRLALVERATINQSLQLRRWWNTPCVQFASGGWNLYLKKGPATGGVHFWHGSPYILVWTGALNYEMWSALFTHEIAETLVDPINTTYNANGSGRQLEVADPVENQTYRLDGVNVTNFVTPNWYAGATTGACETIGAGNPQIICSGPQIAPSPNVGPWDQAGRLTGPWQDRSDKLG